MTAGSSRPGGDGGSQKRIPRGGPTREQPQRWQGGLSGQQQHAQRPWGQAETWAGTNSSETTGCLDLVQVFQKKQMDKCPRGFQMHLIFFFFFF